jgi:hypothetical protein
MIRLERLNAAIWVMLPLYLAAVPSAAVWWLVPSWRVLPIVVMLMVGFWVVASLVIQSPWFADRVAQHELPAEGTSVPSARQTHPALGDRAVIADLEQRLHLPWRWQEDQAARRTQLTEDGD